MRSPRTWGWTVASSELRLTSAALLTHVGMDRARPARTAVRRSAPHARGDGPTLSEQIAGVPPFPAQAGIRGRVALECICATACCTNPLFHNCVLLDRPALPLEERDRRRIRAPAPALQAPDRRFRVGDADRREAAGGLEGKSSFRRRDRGGAWCEGDAAVMLAEHEAQQLQRSPGRRATTSPSPLPSPTARSGLHRPTTGAVTISAAACHSSSVDSGSARWARRRWAATAGSRGSSRSKDGEASTFAADGLFARLHPDEQRGVSSRERQSRDPPLPTPPGPPDEAAGKTPGPLRLPGPQATRRVNAMSTASTILPGPARPRPRPPLPAPQRRHRLLQPAQALGRTHAQAHAGLGAPVLLEPSRPAFVPRPVAHGRS